MIGLVPLTAIAFAAMAVFLVLFWWWVPFILWGTPVSVYLQIYTSASLCLSDHEAWRVNG